MPGISAMKVICEHDGWLDSNMRNRMAQSSSTEIINLRDVSFNNLVWCTDIAFRDRIQTVSN